MLNLKYCLTKLVFVVLKIIDEMADNLFDKGGVAVTFPIGSNEVASLSLLLLNLGHFLFL